MHPEDHRTYVIDRNINYTNVCTAKCTFCAFRRDHDDQDAYTLTFDTIGQKIRDLVAIGGTQILMQGGMNDALPIEWYEDLLRYIKSNFPTIHIHAFSPPEFVEFERFFDMDVRDVIRTLVDGGRLLEVNERWARNVTTGFARLDGRAVGVVANQPRHLGGVLDADAATKAARFVRTCDLNGLPLVVLVDTPGFLPGTGQERYGVIRHGAGLLHAFSAYIAGNRRVITFSGNLINFIYVNNTAFRSGYIIVTYLQ